MKTLTDLQNRAVRRGFGEQIHRHKQSLLEEQGIEIIVRVKVRASNAMLAEQLVKGALGRNPRDMLSVERLTGVVDKTKFEDLRAYVQTLEEDANDVINDKLHQAMEEALENASESAEYWTMKDMADYHGIATSTMHRWLKKKPVYSMTKQSGQWRIHPDYAKNYIPPKKNKPGPKPQ